MRLQGKTAIITGSGSGFGEGIAKTFAREGATVVVNDVNADGGNRVLCRDPPTPAARASFCRRRRHQMRRAVQAMVEHAVETLSVHGSLDILVNNAGVSHKRKPMLDVAEAELDRILGGQCEGPVPHGQRRGPRDARQRRCGCHRQHRLDRRRAAPPRPHLVQRLERARSPP